MFEAEKLITVPFDVYRFDPAVGGPPRYQHYELRLAPHTPILTGLLKIRDEIDPTLTLRYSCRSAICGSCAMLVNSKSRLACRTPVGPEVKEHGRIVIDPMRNRTGSPGPRGRPATVLEPLREDGAPPDP